MPSTTADDRFFGPETLRFLRELARNNNRAWFTENKPRYESSVQTPALRFVTAMGPRLARLSRHVVADSRPFGGSLSRIYRDTRFSKDKSPYKTHVGIHFFHERSPEGENLPGFYLHLAPGESMAASGIWRPAPPALAKIRKAVVASPSAWGRVLGKDLKLGGESYVRVPAGFDPQHQYADDLRRKDFYAHQAFSDAEVVARSFGTRFESSCRNLDRLNRFLATALGIPW